DLDELNIQNDSHRFWENIRYKSQPEMETAPSGIVDYYTLSRERASGATFVITNHSFLAHHFMKEKSDFPPFDRLIVDEAHRFPEVTQQTATKTFHYAYLSTKLKQIGARKSEN